MDKSINSSKIKSIKLNLASPENIREWSNGVVTKSETINYKTLKSEKDGLFCERIFGPTKDFECFCGKYKRAKNRGKVCERCGVEITESIVRRERFGHIELGSPVSHIWMLKANPSKISMLLGIKTKSIEEIIYFVSYIVVDPGTCPKLKYKDLIDQNRSRDTFRTIFNELAERFEKEKKPELVVRAKELALSLDDFNVAASFSECLDFLTKHTGVKFDIGASSIEKLLAGVDLDKEFKKVKAQLRKSKSATKNALIQRIQIIQNFRKSENKPEWMVMHCIPVIPPDLRPIIQLDGGKFTTSEINDLYRRIIIRNDRLKRIMGMGAPNVIINNEKRMLQESVDALFDNQRKLKPALNKSKKPLKSLSDVLKGKQGRFRQNLLGKRVDYSGRSVIVVGPDLKMNQCGLPRDMALQLFRPFIIHELIERELCNNIKIADKWITKKDNRVWPVLEAVVKKRPVLLNRAPTLHRLGIQAYEVILTNDKAIRLHPLATTAFNADFDGDQMAVHVPITNNAIREARTIMIGSSNVIGPKDGKAIVTPSQDMILGNYYLTAEKHDQKGEGCIFSDEEDATKAYENDRISLHALIFISIKNSGIKTEKKYSNGYLMTTVGKIIFNSAFPSNFPFINEGTKTAFSNIDISRLYLPQKNFREATKTASLKTPFKKGFLQELIYELFENYSQEETADSLDRIKSNGFKFSTKSGTSISLGDIKLSATKKNLVKNTEKIIDNIEGYYHEGMVTNSERHVLIINEWIKVKDKIQKELEGILISDVENSIFKMTDSGARSNISNYTQLAGMRGLMLNPKGETIELPIISSFQEGLTVSEYFISTHGARKGMADIALKTADSGYLTRRLVDAAQEIIIKSADCGTFNSFEVEAIRDQKSNTTIVALRNRVVGRALAQDIKDNNKVIFANGHTVTNKDMDVIEDLKIEKVQIRSVLTCGNPEGICQKCYGIDLATHSLVKKGTAVGIMAAQSIGEPGTQLTMRTFHTGGTAGGLDITQGLPRIKELLDVVTPKGRVATISSIYGKVTHIEEKSGVNFITITNNSASGKFIDEQVFKTQYNAYMRVSVEDSVVAGQKLTDGAIDLKELLKVTDVISVQNYILKEVQRVYRLQGIEISDKYIEIIIHQMLKKISIIDGGDTQLLSGTTVNIVEFQQANEKAFLKGKLPALGKRMISGIKKAPLQSNSFLSAASFQDTIRVLTNAAIKGSVDYLEGLKENVIIGNIIPAGTGIDKDYTQDV